MDLPPIDMILNAEGAPSVLVAQDQEYTTIDALLAAVPALIEPAHAVPAAEAVNHLSEGYGFGVILDPAAFETAYFARYDAEATQEWQQGTPRLRDFGKPDLSVLAPPQIEDGTLTFFADDKYLGLAYKVTMPFSAPTADYQPVPMGQ